MLKNYFKITKYLLQNLRKQIRNNYLLYKLQNRFPALIIEEDVQIKNPDKLEVGKNVIIQKGSILHCGGMRWSNYEGCIKIDDDSVISPYCVLFGAGGIEIGKRFDCGPGVMIFSSRTKYSLMIIGQKNEERYFNKVVIRDDVILFAGAIVNIGVTIGDGAVVAAGSIVLSDIPPREVWGGIPAKFIKKRCEDENN